MLQKTGFYVRRLRVYYNPLENLLPEGGWKGKVLMTFFWYLAKLFSNGFRHRIEAQAIKTGGAWT